MAIIYTYPSLSTLASKDSFLVTDMSDKSKTKKITLEDFLKADGLVQNLKVTLTSAQILDLHNTPVELIPAPGTNKFIVVLSVYSFLDFNTTPYTTQNNSDIRCRYGDNTIQTNYVNLIGRTSVGQSQDAYRAYSGFFPFNTSPPLQAWLPNTNVQVYCDAANTVGDSPINIYISYIIKDL